MAKISPVSIKYTIFAKFTAEGAVEKPDIIGALFGQTEGLLGSELEMRELQKEGKIGRIEVEFKNEDGKTLGTIQIPSAMDKAETALIAASIETIDRIGPTDAKIEIEKIEDVRGEKRGYIVDRAKKLLEGISGSQETREMADNLKTQSRLSKLQEYGDEKLPAGNISEHEIIVVEGRADVINLLKNGVENVIGMNGTNLPAAIKELSYDKEITLFVDGDRGGRLIAKNVCENARVDFIASAPDGKEVEELMGKEILSALRKKVSVNEFFRNDRMSMSRERFRDRDYGDRRERFVREERPREEEKPREPAVEVEIDKEKLKKMMTELEGSKSAYLLDRNLEVIKQSNLRSLGLGLRRTENVAVLVIDGLVTGNIIRSAEESGIKAIAARNFASTDTSIKLISL